MHINGIKIYLGSSKVMDIKIHSSRPMQATRLVLETKKKTMSIPFEFEES